MNCDARGPADDYEMCVDCQHMWCKDCQTRTRRGSAGQDRNLLQAFAMDERGEVLKMVCWECSEVAAGKLSADTARPPPPPPTTTQADGPPALVAKTAAEMVSVPPSRWMDASMAVWQGLNKGEVKCDVKRLCDPLMGFPAGLRSHYLKIWKYCVEHEIPFYVLATGGIYLPLRGVESYDIA